MKLPSSYLTFVATFLLVSSVFAQTDKETAAVIVNEQKLKNIVIPSLEFVGTPLGDALQFIQSKSVELDFSEVDPNKKGVNIILQGEGGESKILITLRLTNVPLGEALRYTASLGQLKYRVESHGVVVKPVGDPDKDLFTNQYTVPPTFLSSGGGGAADPFAPASPVRTRQTAKQILENAGIIFPQGATAIYNPGSSALIVKNTTDQMELVEAYLDSIRGGVEKSIYVSAKFFISSEPIPGIDENGAIPVPAPNGISRAFERWNDLKEFINSEDLAKLMESSRERDAYRKAHKSGAIEVQGVYTEARFQAFLKEVAQNKNIEAAALKSVTVRSGESAFFSIDLIALGVGVVLGADNYTIDLNFLTRNLAEPAVGDNQTSQVTILDGQTILIGGKVAKDIYVSMAITAVIHDPAGVRIHGTLSPPEPSGKGQ